MSTNAIDFRAETLPFPLWHTSSHEVLIRLQLATRDENRRYPEAYYLVTSGFYKMLHELDVTAFRHSFGEKGLRFYMEVQGSFASVKAYLMNLKQWHALGEAWDLVILDGIREYPVLGPEDRKKLLPSRNELWNLARGHMRMGSRPLRFSRYLLYAALAPFGRRRCYGSCSMRYEDAAGEADFTQYLQALAVLTENFRRTDFSRIASFAALRAMGLSIEAQLPKKEIRRQEMDATLPQAADSFLKESLSTAEEQFSSEMFTELFQDKGSVSQASLAAPRAASSNILFHGLLFHALFFAACYHQKVPFAEMPEAIIRLSAGLEKDYFRADDSDGLRLFRAFGMGGARRLALAGYEPLFSEALPFWRAHPNEEDRSLFLIGQIYDTTALMRTGVQRYRALQAICRKALSDDTIRRASLSAFFEENGIVTDGCRDLYALVLLLELLEEESREDAESSTVC